MPSLNMLIQLLLVFELPSAFAIRAVECRLRHVVYQCIDQVAQASDLFKLLVVRNVLMIQIILMRIKH